MSAGGPPARPTGWFARLLELGNHNKLVAAATLLTIATGVPYVVTSAVRALAGEEGDPQAEMRALFAEALEGSNAELLRRAEEQSLVHMRSQIESMVAEQMESLGMVRDAALREGATPEEQERLSRAMFAFASGSSSEVLDEIGRIAREQEARGALEEAAETWRKRAVLLVSFDGAGALRDLEHAETLHPADAAATFLWASLVYDYVNTDAAFPALGLAVERARAEGDRRVLAMASMYQASCVYAFSVLWTEENLRLARALALEAVRTCDALLSEDPTELEFAAHLGAAVVVALERGLSPGPELDEMRASVRRWRDHVEGLDAAARSDATATVARAQLLVADGSLLMADGRIDEGAALLVDAVHAVSGQLERLRPDRHFIFNAWMVAYLATSTLLSPEVLRYAEAEESARVAAAVVAAGLEQFPDNPAAWSSLSRARDWLRLSQAAQGRAADAAATAEETLRLIRAGIESGAFASDPLRVRALDFVALARAAVAYETVDPARARELAAEAEAAWVGLPELAGDLAGWITADRESLDALQARITEGDA